VSRRVKRTVTIDEPHEQPQVTTQTVTLTRTVDHDEVTGTTTYGQWTPQTLKEVPVPEVKGYTATVTDIPEVKVTDPDQKVDNVTIDYTANKQTLTVHYVDDDDPTNKLADTT